MKWLKTLSIVQILVSFAEKTRVRKHLIFNLVGRDLKNRYVGSLMGFFWSVIHPVVLLICYTFIFSIIFKVKPFIQATDNFAVFLFCGILPWLFFQETVTRSCTSIIDNSNLIRKSIFPSEILPLTLLISSLVTHIVGLGILFIVLLVMGLFSWTWIFFLVYLVLLMLLLLGVGWMVAALQVFLRDTLQLVNVFMVMWFWFTPIFYSMDNENIPEKMRMLLYLNPLSYVVRGYRACFLEHRVPDLGEILILAGFSMAAFILGGLLFRNTKREFIDVL